MRRVSRTRGRDEVEANVTGMTAEALARRRGSVSVRLAVAAVIARHGRLDQAGPARFRQRVAMMARVPVGRAARTRRSGLVERLLTEDACDGLPHQGSQLVFVEAHRSPR